MENFKEELYGNCLVVLKTDGIFSHKYFYEEDWDELGLYLEVKTVAGWNTTHKSLHIFSTREDVYPLPRVFPFEGMDYEAIISAPGSSFVKKLSSSYMGDVSSNPFTPPSR